MKKIKIEDLIEYELINHESYYIGDFTEVIFVVKDYYNDLSDEEIYNKVKDVYDSTKDKYLSDFDDGKISI